MMNYDEPLYINNSINISLTTSTGFVCWINIVLPSRNSFVIRKQVLSTDGLCCCHGHSKRYAVGKDVCGVPLLQSSSTTMS